MELKELELLSDERRGEGGFLHIRRLTLRLVGADGTKTKAGVWDFVERPAGLDAVVLALWKKPDLVLLRHAVRVPLQFGRPDRQPLLLPELVAGILEPGDDLLQRARAEALEEAGLHIGDVELLGEPLFPSPGMTPELFHFACAEVTDEEPTTPPGDGSPFEEGARLEWVRIDDALGRGLKDMKTEIGLRRLKDKLTRAG